MNFVSRHFLITGKVQGVFFRGSAKEEADKLGVTGWVKNTADGNVEIFCSGTSEKIQAFESWCHCGPPLASVESVRVLPVLNDDTPAGFSILR